MLLPTNLQKNLLKDQLSFCKNKKTLSSAAAVDCCLILDPCTGNEYLLGHPLGKPLPGVEPGPDGRPPRGQHVHPWHGAHHALDPKAHLAGVPAKLLSKEGLTTHYLPVN